MKNKEIEELLNELKDKYSYEPYDTTGKVYTTISYEEGQLLLSYIEQLEKENGLQKERIAYLERSNNRREDTIISLQDELIDIETNRDKAIEFINSKEFNNLTTNKRKKLNDILKGDSDE